jgi:hypothetical protein
MLRGYLRSDGAMRLDQRFGELPLETGDLESIPLEQSPIGAILAQCLPPGDQLRERGEYRFGAIRSPVHVHRYRPSARGALEAVG